MENKFLFLIGVFLLSGLIGFTFEFPAQVFSALGEYLGEDSALGALLTVLAVPALFCSWLFTFWINLGRTNIALRLSKKQDTTLKDLFLVGWMPYFQGLITSIIVGILNASVLIIAIPAAIPGGMVFFKYLSDEGSVALTATDWAWAIIPLAVAGILAFAWMMFWNIRFGYFPAAILQGADIIESLRISWRITKGNFWRIVLLGFCMLGVTLCGLLAFFIGLVAAIPFILLLDVAAFLELSRIAGVEETPEAIGITPIAEIAPAEVIEDSVQ